MTTGTDLLEIVSPTNGNGHGEMAKTAPVAGFEENGTSRPAAPDMLKFINPASGNSFGELPMATPADVEQAMAEMRTAARIWARKDVATRVAVLRKFQKLLIDSMDEITDVINQDCGKSRQDAMIEVFITVDMLDSYLQHAKRWLKRYEVSSSMFFFKKCYVEPRPYGVVAVISPWNYPFALAMPPVLGALLAGNTVVLKPSEVTAATGLLLERLIERVPEMKPFVRVLHGDGRVGAALVQSDPDYIFLTGSTLTGRTVAKVAAEKLTPLACELGGKDAMIVLEDADLAAAARWGVWGAFFNAGQTCMAVERVYVHEQVYDQFLELVLHETERFTMGYSRDTASMFDLGPITDPRQLKVIAAHLADAQERGARVLAGGEMVGNFVSPTVLVDVTHDMKLMNEETFGPFMPIVKVASDAEAIELANDSQLGLGASVWSRDLQHAWKVARQIEASSVIINDTITQFAVPMLPFGGIKHSGYGRIHGKEGVVQFTRPYAYAVGQPPPAFDIATIMRSPGNYELGKAVLKMTRGTSTRQRLEPVVGAVQGTVKRVINLEKRGLLWGVQGASHLVMDEVLGRLR
ncbi:MAG: aldehyde dehydrogenase family protein [Anaerolinea sp.]|nr:aldehyde dehydrogenase family protein [Anaerolinea sp.]HRI55515.1 aldehyde dehydrogenase family protein [Anaerolineae bacterium]